jgi:hypothetical protein
MDKLTVLLEQLAAKLGVAVDVLWAALMRQALISGIADLIFLGAVAAFLFGTWKYVVLVHRKVEAREWDEIAWLPCGFVAVAMVGITFAALAGLPMMFAAFFNPEYWALMRILK